MEVATALQPILVKHYHQLIGTCIKHIRASHLTLEMLVERAGNLRDKERARLFAAEERRLFYVALTRASRGVFLLANARQPSHYIRELSEVAGGDIRFETLDGKPLHQCPSCLVGQMVERRTEAGRTFLGCSQYPECRHTSRAGSRR